MRGTAYGDGSLFLAEHTDLSSIARWPLWHIIRFLSWSVTVKQSPLGSVYCRNNCRKKSVFTFIDSWHPLWLEMSNAVPALDIPLCRELLIINTNPDHRVKEVKQSCVEFSTLWARLKVRGDLTTESRGGIGRELQMLPSELCLTLSFVPPSSILIPHTQWVTFKCCVKCLRVHYTVEEVDRHVFLLSSVILSLFLFWAIHPEAHYFSFFLIITTQSWSHAVRFVKQNWATLC